MAVETDDLRTLVAARYPNNTTRAISARDLRDGMNLVADLIDAEGTARGDADTAFAEALDNEADLRLDGDSTERTARIAADAAERSERIAADNALSLAISNVSSNNAASLLAERNARIAADSAEQSARIAADNALADALDDESAERAQAIQTERTERIAADGAEQAARIAADVAEQTARAQAIQTERTERIAADGAEQAARIAADGAEQTARIAADTTLQNNINAVVDGLGSASASEIEDFATAEQGVRADAALLAPSVNELRGEREGGAINYPLPIFDREGRVVGFRDDGAVVSTQVIDVVAGDPADRDLGGPFPWAHTDGNGRVFYGVGADGKPFFSGTAMQADLSTVATSGEYTDLAGLPVLGSAAALDAGDVATAEQGLMAERAIDEVRLEELTGDRNEAGPDYPIGLVDEDNFVVGIRKDGALVGRHLLDAANAPSSDRDNGGPYLWAHTDSEGRVFWGIGHDGLPFFHGVDTGGGGGGGGGDEPSGGAYIDPAPYGMSGVFNMRTAEGALYASTSLVGGMTVDVRRVLGAPEPTTSVGIGAPAIRAFLVTGQSNAGAGSGPTGTNPERDSHFPHHFHMPDGYNAYGTSNAAANIALRTIMRPYKGTPTNAISPGGAIGTAIVGQDSMSGRVPPVRVSSTAWEGGNPITSFFPATAGHYNFENAVALIQAMQRTATPYLPTVLDAVFFIQGENASVGYADLLRDYIDDVVPLFSAAIGQAATPHFFFRQINLGSASGGPNVNASHLPQLEVARERFGAGVTLTGPMYNLQVHDDIHSDNVGRMMGGDLDAHVYHQVVTLGRNWHPLWPEAGGITVAGNTITIPMELPPDALGLSWDDDWVAPAPNKGFAYSDSGSGATITNVEIVGTDIVITMSSDISAATDRRIEYAHFNASPVPNWAGGRGQLYARSVAKSTWRQLGFPLPYENIRFYCVRFSEVF